jgi:hypothetical protein
MTKADGANHRAGETNHPNNDPSRSTSIAGKAGERMGNPMKRLEKAAPNRIAA